jgi:hypothetical protein
LIFRLFYDRTFYQKNKKMTDKQEKVKVTPVISAFNVLQKLINNKNVDESKKNFSNMSLTEPSNASLVKISFNNSISRAESPLVKEFTITAENYDLIFAKLLEVQDLETQEAIKLLYLYMAEKKNFNLDVIDGKELLELGGYSRIRKEEIDKVLRCVLRYLGMVVTVLDPNVETKKRGKKEVIYRQYSHFTVLNVGKTHTREEKSKDGRELIYKLTDVKFMDGYMNYIDSVSRIYIPLKSIVNVPKISSKDKRRNFINNICEKFSYVRSEVLSKTLEECMEIGGFVYKMWSKNKAKAWKPIESALLQAQDMNLIKFEWHKKDGEIIPGCGTLDPKIFKTISHVKLTRIYKI